MRPLDDTWVVTASEEEREHLHPLQKTISGLYADALTANEVLRVGIVRHPTHNLPVATGPAWKFWCALASDKEKLLTATEEQVLAAYTIATLECPQEELRASCFRTALRDILR